MTMTNKLQQGGEELSKTEEWGAWRIVSDMLDNPDELGIYPTAECYRRLYDFVVEQKALAKREVAEEMIEEIESNLTNQWDGDLYALHKNSCEYDVVIPKFRQKYLDNQDSQ